MQKVLWPLLVVLALVVAGCGQAVEAPAGSGTIGDETFQVALPRLVVDVDAEGNPSILGISPLFLTAFGVDVSAFQIPLATVTSLTAAKIQHIEVASVGDRLMFFVNGEPMPHLGWSSETMNRALDLAVALQVGGADTLQKVLPLVTRLGLDVVVRLPRPAGAAEIPMTEPGSAKRFMPSPSTEPAGAIVKFEVRYDEAGRAAIMGLSQTDLAALGLGELGRLQPATLRNLQENNIQHIELRTKPEGAYVYVNGEPLPRIIWDSQLLANLVAVYSGLAADSPVLPLIQQLAPFADRADIGILLHFPLAPGAQQIPAQMH